MQKVDCLSELELLILLAVIHLRDEAYAVPIVAYIETHRGRQVALGRVYAVLETLAESGHVTSHLGEPTAARGGKAKRFFAVTDQGLRKVQETRNLLTAMWKKIPAWKEGRTSR